MICVLVTVITSIIINRATRVHSASDLNIFWDVDKGAVDYKGYVGYIL